MQSRRFLLIWMIVLLLIVIGFLAGSLAVRRAVVISFDATERIRTARAVLFAAFEAQLDEETGVRGYAATRDALFLQPYEAARSTLPATFDALASELRDLSAPRAQNALVDARRTNTTWLRDVAGPLIAHGYQNPVAIQKRGKALVDRFRADVATIEASLRQSSQDAADAFASSIAHVGTLVVIVAILFVGSGFIFSTALTQAWDVIDRERREAFDEHARANALRIAYETEKHVSETLQEAVAQSAMPAIASMTFSATYVPATEEAKVGGDWYEAIELGADKILFTIGDVAGHGIEAAVTMSRTRTAVISAALLDDDPSRILTRVNDGMLSRGSVPMVTAVVGIADAQNYEFVYSTAGHPPPILLEPGRMPRLLEFGGLPLGISERADYRLHRVQTVPGAVLVLYTDGVIEHSRDVLEGERLLLEAISSARSRGTDIASSIYASIFEHAAAGDDVAILTLGFAAPKRTGITVSAEDANSAYTARLHKTPPTKPGPDERLAS